MHLVPLGRARVLVLARFARCGRDARAMGIYAGTSEAQRAALAAKSLGL
jgi:alkylation response protein AidB-like acyl-CoA dehydrogenase